MTPRPASIHRILPFGLPALLALLLIAWIFQSSRDGGSDGDSTANVRNAPASEKTKAARTIEDTLADAARAGVDLSVPVAAPANPLVADFIERFEKGDRKIPEQAIRDLVSRPLGKKFAFNAAGIECSGTVDSRLDLGEVLHIGVTLDDGLGRFQMSLRKDNRIQASLLFNGESHAFAFRGLPENGAWTMAATTVDHVLCTPVGTVYPVGRGQMAMPLANPGTTKGPARAPMNAPPILNSNPSSPFVIYCDFDGEVVTNPLWNDGVTINAEPHARSDDSVFVTRVWERVSEDFAPFNINVTTDRAVFDAAAPSRRVHCVVTPTDTAAQGAGGVAYVGSFGYEIPCWAFNDTEAACADTISHEVGHTVGLVHDGQVNGFAYYGGHGVGPTSWAPIMGAYFADFDPPFVEEELTQFSKGEYPDADNQEDDLGIITTSNGFTYRNDDKGNSLDAATPLTVTAGKASDSGIIERNTDTDWFSFATSGGPVNIAVTVTSINSSDDPQRGSNLAVSAELLDSAGARVLLANPQDDVDATISTSLAAGNYFLKIDGAGRGDLVTGFSDYASLGRYTISGVVPQVGIVTVTPPSAELPRQGGGGSFKVNTNDPWTWTTDVDWVVSTESLNQAGTQVFEYVVNRNAGREDRTASVKITSGVFTATHFITQKGSETDDHGDVFESATLVEQVSVTNGILEEEEDVDMFQINVRGFGTLTVNTTGTTDTYGELYDALGNRIAANDNALAPNFSMSYSVGAGIYYASVRHAHEGGVGAYQLVCDFENGPALIIDPPSRIVGAGGGSFLLRVISNEAWSWTSDSSWVTSPETAQQVNGKSLAYTVAPNNTSRNRSARITLTTPTRSVVHQITQLSSKADDHGDSLSKATSLAQNGKAAGKIESEGDVDLFKIVLQTSGELALKTTGSMDSYGELLNSKGKKITSDDDGEGDNFGINQAVSAGVYYVKVRHFTATGLGSYQLFSEFTPSRLVDVHYAAGEEGGTVFGPKKQKVPLGGASRTVRASAKPGYSFLKWSDGRKSSVRSDSNLRTHLDVTALFIRTMSVKTASGAYVEDNQSPPVDFGTVDFNRTRRVTFTIRNNGTRTLKNLRVAQSGPQAEAWSHSALSRTTLKPWQTAKLTVTLQSSFGGYKSAVFTIVAPGSSSSFRLRTMGVVNPRYVGSTRESLVLEEDAPADSPDFGIAAAPAPDATLAEGSGPARSPQWLAVSEDGFFHHRFQRSAADRTEPEFWISVDGITWEDALVLDVWRVARGETGDKFEAIIAPPVMAQPFILVSETPPITKKQ